MVFVPKEQEKENPMYVQKYEKMWSKEIKKRKAINARINERNMPKYATQLQHQRSGKERKKQQQQKHKKQISK